MPQKKAGGRHPHLSPWEKRGIRMGGGVGTVERDCPFLFRRLLSLSIFSNKNVSIHVFFFKDKKDKENKREWIHKPQRWFSKDGLELYMKTRNEKTKSVDITLREKTGHNHMPISFKVSIKRHLILPVC